MAINNFSQGFDAFSAESSNLLIPDLISCFILNLRIIMFVTQLNLRIGVASALLSGWQTARQVC